MNQIEIDDEVLAVIKQNAEPFVDPPDTPNAVLRRLLVEGSSKKARASTHKRASLNTLLPENDYWVPILEAIEERGGSAPAADVVEAVGEKLKDKLTDEDYGSLGSGKVRWINRTQFARLRMKESGLLKSDSPRGLWEISEAGRARLEQTD